MTIRCALGGGVRVAIVGALFVGACSGSDSSTPTTASSPSVSGSTLPVFVDEDEVDSGECSTASLAEIPDWPFDVVDLFVPVVATVDGLTYTAQGVTSDAEALLVTALNETFAGLDATEPDGGATDITVDFSDDNSTIALTMEDPDEDDCWDVVVVAEYVEQPPVRQQTVNAPAPEVTTPDVAPSTPSNGSGTPEPGEPPTSSDFDAPPDGGVGDTVAPPDPLDEVGGAGGAEVIAGRGTFRVGITQCGVNPVDVQGVSSDGTLSMTGTAPDDVSVTWTYPDGVVVEDDDARVIALTAAGGTIIAEGSNDEGPESIIVNLVCVVAE
jgi:hypothetical protein